MQKIITSLVLFFYLAGCTSTRVLNSDKYIVELGAGLGYHLLQPASYGQSLSLTQVAEISTDQGQHELVFVLQLEANEMTVIGLLPNGTRVFSIYYDGSQLKSEGYNELIEKIDPKYLLADIQISLWPIEILKQQWLFVQPCYQNSHCSISENTDSVDGSRQRTITVDGKQLVDIQFSAATTQPRITVLKHLERSYQIILESTE